MCACIHTHTHLTHGLESVRRGLSAQCFFFATPCGSLLEKATKAQTASVRGTSSSLPLPPSPFLCHSVSPLTQSSLFDSSAEAQAARLSRFEQRRNKGVLIMDYSVRLYGATALLKTEIRTARDSRGLEDFLAPRTSWFAGSRLELLRRLPKWMWRWLLEVCLRVIAPQKRAGARLCHTRDLLAFICVKHRLFWRWHLDEWPDSVRDILHPL